MKITQEMNGKIPLLLVLLIGLIFTGCSKIFKTDTEDNFAYHSQSGSKGSSDFSNRIAALEKITINHPDPSVQTKARLELAMLHSSYKNPKPDYRRALDELEVYIFLDPEGGRDDAIQNWLAVLRTLQKLEEENNKIKWIINQLTTENQSLAEENKEMKETIEHLETLDKEMKETIEQLKSLDLRLEEKRKNIK
ncbi:MAG TPA: hypothetical protein VLB01_07950 [Thermodesulfobacteriota bacterium]|nr:hypothetical protein [Thermodesulfobacteriota bacterium]